MSKIALDLGTTTGWAALVDGQIVSGIWRFTPGRFEGGGMRFVRFRNKLAELIAEVEQVSGQTPHIWYEEVRRHLGTDAAHIYGGFQSHLQAFCDEATPQIPYGAVPVGTIKKHATGKGNANKGAMINACYAKWPDVKIADDNEADARWLLDYVLTNQ